MQSQLDAVVQQAMGSIGAFERILITQSQNVAKGLEHNLIREIPYVTGVQGAKALANVRQPITTQDYYRKLTMEQPQSSVSTSRSAKANIGGSSSAELLKSIGKALIDKVVPMMEQEARDNASEGVQYNSHPAQTGGNFVSSG